MVPFTSCARLLWYHLTNLLKLLSRTVERGSAADISYWEPGLDLRSSLSFTAKRLLSAFPQTESCVRRSSA
uniref:Uncharacterized protein n=1 Tax=Takifugu rubripes TaxID=31033 RepID=A0A3B5KDB4_TAKRU